MKRLIAVAISTLVLSSALVGCGSSSSSSASGSSSSTTGDKIKGEISFMTYRDDLLNSWYPKVLEEFKAKYPDIKVTTSTSKNYDQDLKVKMSAGDVPDVFTVSGDRYSDAQRTQYMLPLDDVFPDLVKSWNGNANNINQGDKKTYALTYGGQGIGIAYNKKIFAEAGIAAPPKTLDELITDAKLIKAKGKIGLAGVLKPKWTTQPYWWTAQALLADQTTDLKAMAASDAPFTIDSSWGKMAQVLVKLRDAKIMEEDPASYDWEPYRKDFGSGKIGMTFTWSNTPVQFPGAGDGTVKLEDIGFVPFPYDNGGSYKTLVQADWAVALSKSSKNMPAAKAFYSFLMNEKYEAYIKETASLSAKTGVVTDVPYLKEFANAKPVNVNAVQFPVEFKTILDKAQLDMNTQYAEIGAGIDVQKEFDNMNAAWKKAKGK